MGMDGWTTRSRSGTSARLHAAGGPSRSSAAVSMHDVPLPMAVACPRCGGWAFVMVPTGAVRESEGSYVLPLEPLVAALTV